MESPEATEVFVTIRPIRRRGVGEQARLAYAQVRDVLRAERAHLVQERVFATEGAAPAVREARADALGGSDDGVPPVRLIVPEGPGGDLLGLHVHAVRAREAPAVLRLGESACGRSLESPGRRYVALSSLVAPEAGPREAQARAIYEKADALLRGAGLSMRSVARTWLWLRDILDWYGEFNQVRNRFFLDCGLLNGSPRENRLPASTGIGVRPAGGPACGLDVVAVNGLASSIEFLRAAGNQQCAYNYGSAFSRTARVTTPAGTTVYVSGTAAIDLEGRSQYIGDPRAQIEATLTNVRAVLADMGCGDSDVVYAYGYSKTPDVERVFQDVWRGFDWPCVSVVSDVCRPELLFELEATACPGAKRR